MGGMGRRVDNREALATVRVAGQSMSLAINA
jgi:hypothetical protein